MANSFSFSVGGFAEDDQTATAVADACRAFGEQLVADFGAAITWSSFSGLGAWPAASADDPAVYAQPPAPDPAPASDEPTP